MKQKLGWHGRSDGPTFRVDVITDRGWPKDRRQIVEADNLLRLEVSYRGDEKKNWLQIALKDDRWSIAVMQGGSYINLWGVHGTVQTRSVVQEGPSVV